MFARQTWGARKRMIHLNAVNARLPLHHELVCQCKPRAGLAGKIDFATRQGGRMKSKKNKTPFRKEIVKAYWNNKQKKKHGDPNGPNYRKRLPIARMFANVPSRNTTRGKKQKQKNQ